MGSFELNFTAPDKLLNMNGSLNRYTRASRVKSWREAAFYHARALRIPSHGPCIVEWTITFPTQRRRDPHNFFPTLKPIIDGLVDAKVWPDDTPEWVATREPSFAVRPGALLPHISIRCSER